MREIDSDYSLCSSQMIQNIYSSLRFEVDGIHEFEGTTDKVLQGDTSLSP